MLTRFIVIFSILALSGCATVGEVDPLQKTSLTGTNKALLSGDSEHNHGFWRGGLDQRVYISELDGKSLYRLGWTSEYPESMLIEPGRHTIGVKYTLLNSYATAQLWFDAVKEKSYKVKKKIDGYSVFFWIEDTETGERVGGIPGGEPKFDPTK